MDRKAQYRQDGNFPQIDLYNQHNPYQNPSTLFFFDRNWHTDPKNYMEMQNNNLLL